MKRNTTCIENKVHDRGSDRIERDVLDTRFYFYCIIAQTSPEERY